jgi:membrane-bound lytic murein transglycosylase MltF
MSLFSRKWMDNRLAGSLLLALLVVGCGKTKEPEPVKTEAPASAAAPTEAAAPSSAASEQAIRQPWSGDLDGMLRRRYVRVLVIPDKMYFFFDGTQLRGVTADVMRDFEKFLNERAKTGKMPVSIVFIPSRRDEILKDLAAGRGDIAVAGLAITPERLKVVDFSIPTRDNLAAIPVTAPGTTPIKTIDDLSGKEVYVPASSVFKDVVSRLNKDFRERRMPEMRLVPADENLEPSDILEMVNAGLVKMTFAEQTMAEFWSRVFEQLTLGTVPVAENRATGWAWRKGSPQMEQAANDFIKTRRAGTLYGNTMLHKYLGSQKWIKNAISGEDLENFKQMVALFRKYGDRFDLPYLLVAAQAYQESRLDQSVRSSAGAVGVMQIKPATAAGHPISIENIDNLDNNIHAGVKYLRFLLEQYYKDAPMDRINRGLFAIASYNAGPNRIRQLQRKASQQGLDPNRWFNNVEQVAAREIGRETVQYVSNIYKYYLAYEMITRQTAARTQAAGKIKARPQ